MSCAVIDASGDRAGAVLPIDSSAESHLRWWRMSCTARWIRPQDSRRK